MRSRVLGPKWLVTMMRRPASGKRYLGGLALMISSTMTTEPRLNCLAWLGLTREAKGKQDELAA